MTGVVVPVPLAPMAPMLLRPPFHRDGWVYEEKVDGWRMLAYKDGHRVRLISRNAVDHTWRFADLAAAIAKLKRDVVVLDGEVAVFDEKLVSRVHLLGEPDPAIVTTPPTPPLFMAFDVLYARGRDLRAESLSERRHRLECDVQANCWTASHAIRSSHRRSAGVWPRRARWGRRWLYSYSH